MLGGLGFQVATLVLFSVLGLEYAWRVRKHSSALNPETYETRKTWRWKAFLVGTIPPPFLLCKNNELIANSSSTMHICRLNHCPFCLSYSWNGRGVWWCSSIEPVDVSHIWRHSRHDSDWNSYCLSPRAGVWVLLEYVNNTEAGFWRWGCVQVPGYSLGFLTFEKALRQKEMMYLRAVRFISWHNDCVGG